MLKLKIKTAYLILYWRRRKQCSRCLRCTADRPTIRPFIRPADSHSDIRSSIRPNICPSIRPTICSTICPSLRPANRPFVRPPDRPAEVVRRPILGQVPEALRAAETVSLVLDGHGLRLQPRGQGGQAPFQTEALGLLIPCQTEAFRLRIPFQKEALRLLAHLKPEVLRLPALRLGDEVVREPCMAISIVHSGRLK